MEPSQPRRRFRGKKQRHGSSSAEAEKKMDASEIDPSASSSTPPATSSALAKSKETTSFWKRRASGIQIPQDLLDNPLLEKMVSQFPKHYDLEIHKTIWRIRQLKAQRVALQIPEGLLLYACLLSDIFERFCEVETIILGDVNYGACCVDDFTGRLHGVDLLVHYGHSCLVPVSKCSIPILYVFVEIEVDVDLFVKALMMNLSSKLRVVLISTIQFVSGLRAALPSLQDHFDEVMIPQDRPLSKGEILGCTSPVVPERFDAVVSLSDGRFHLESMMISNPSLTAYRFDPYSLTLTKEMYDIERMKHLRWHTIEAARSAFKFGLVVSTLGRQGSSHVVERMEMLLHRHRKKFVKVYMSEITPSKLDAFRDVDAWIQIACPRLSIDWGGGFSRPLLTAFEAETLLGDTSWDLHEPYPMDWYSDKAGPWGARPRPHL